ncbi:hypothetical protein [Parasitella parasitica]|uniref:Late embryogenesis abundant protein LEA-2 subgroup domain-containing protein n=1 Tax=Parasitella parasitica TaxID=35722 RepID=A0A0B7N2A4_9FUNG|nr:hypothetical protein [Parasitella parasitica]
MSTGQRIHALSQSSDEYLQQFPAPPVPHHFSDNDSSRMKSAGYSPQLHTPVPNKNSVPVQKPDDVHDRTTPYPMSNTVQEQASLPNAYVSNTDFNHTDKPQKKVHWTKRHCFFRWICCSMCFPPWVAYIIWFIVIAVIICIIVIGALLGSFKMPTIAFAGLNTTLPNGTQQIQFSSTGVVINAGLILNVINPNVLSMKLSNLTAKAYYPINGTMVQIGKGYLDYQFIPKKSDINFTYPFEIDYNPSDPNSKYLLDSLSDKCGFTGNSPSDINISYDVELNAQVLFVHVSPTISSAASFACPFQDGEIPGLSSSGSSNGGGLGAILGGLGAQVDGSTATSASFSTTVLSKSISTTTGAVTASAVQATGADFTSKPFADVFTSSSTASLLPMVKPTPTFVTHVTSVPSTLTTSLVSASPTSTRLQLKRTSSQRSSDTLVAFHSSSITVALSTPSSAAPRVIPTPDDDEGEDNQDDEGEDDNEDGDGDSSNRDDDEGDDGDNGNDDSDY